MCGACTRRALSSHLSKREEVKAYEEKWSQMFRFFRLLASESVKIRTAKQIITTYEESVLSNHETDTTELAPCTHEEADSRMILHLVHMVNSGCTKYAEDC